jgi:PAS domain S-box-containing protein
MPTSPPPDASPNDLVPAILLVDDNAQNLLALEATLESRGYRLVRASSGEQAVELALNEDFAVVLMDVRMSGINGFDATAMLRARERERRTPVILMTAADPYSQTEEMLSAYAHGAVDYLRKPYSPAVLRSKVGIFVELFLAKERVRQQDALLRARELESLQGTLRERDRVLREAEADREEQRRILSLIIEQSGDAIIMADERGVLRVFNPEAERQHGVGRKEVEAPEWARTFGLYALDGTPLGLEQTPLYRAVHGETVRRAEWVVKRPDGTERVLVGTASPLRRHDGSPAGGVLIARDETELRQLNQGLERRVEERTAQLSAANHELEAFSYSVSHDLRAPLRHISGFADLLMKRAEGVLDEKSREHVRVISEAAKKGGQLVDDLLAFSRMGRTELRRARVSLTEIVAETRQELLSEAEGRAVQWLIDPLPEVQGDLAMLRLVIKNLLSNAVKYTRPRALARIEVGASVVQAPGINAGEETHVWVRDNGVGFDMQHAGQLFGVFQRLHSSEEFEGTGIGLAHVRRIIGRHGGRTWAEGVPQAGATFHFTLPSTVAEGVEGAP